MLATLLTQTASKLMSSTGKGVLLNMTVNDTVLLQSPTAVLPVQVYTVVLGGFRVICEVVAPAIGVAGPVEDVLSVQEYVLPPVPSVALRSTGVGRVVTLLGLAESDRLLLLIVMFCDTVVVPQVPVLVLTV